MTLPNYPSANPGGRHTQLVRTALCDWLGAQQIAGLNEVYPSLRPSVDWDNQTQSAAGCCAIVYVHLANSEERRVANTGPEDPGGKEIIYDAELRIVHRGWYVDGWDDAQDDFDRIGDALKDGLRGRGRDLGRPDNILAAGDWPSAIVYRTAEPVFDEEQGTVDRTGSIFFDIYTYLSTWIPGPIPG